MSVITSISPAARRIALAAIPVLLAVLLLAPGPAHAADDASATSIAGAVRGIELCPQEVCGAAVFVGRFEGALDTAAGEGGWWVVVRHEELPLPGASTAITDGRWGLTVGDHTLGGRIVTGSILNNGDGTFTVMPQLDIRTGGEGTLALSIALDHGPFPPTVAGTVGTGTMAPALPQPQPTPRALPVPGANAA